MTEVNLLTCPWGPRNPERKEKGTRVSKQADLENTKRPGNGVSQGTSQGAHLLGVDGQLYPPTATLCSRVSGQAEQLWKNTSLQI